jgi:formamidopyrimidine-DNA glycosylase
MPELPEVEVVRRGLEGFVTGRTVASVTVLHPRAIRAHLPGSVDFASRLTGRRIEAVRRRGKYLWAPLDSGDAVVAHLGMSGQLLARPADAAYETHLRVRVGFADTGQELRFVDQRTFGGLTVEPMVTVSTGEHLPRRIQHIARDPLDPLFDDDSFSAALRRRRTGLKRALLDQSLVSGIGNIYADEALWRARLHYARRAETLSRVQVRRLLVAVREVLADALAQGGTSFDSLYVDVNGESGYFDRSLAVYGRAGRPCPRCAAPIRREPFQNRSSFRCPRCQRLPRAGSS